MHKNKNLFIVFFLLVFSVGTFLFISGAEAAGLQYTLLEKIQGFASTDGSNLPAYIQAIYKTAMVVIVLCALFMLTVGGFMYLTSAGNTAAMSTAKSVIFDSIIGLVIALVAWLLLNTINPDLVNVTLNGLTAVPVGVPPTAPPPPPGIGAPGTCGGLSPQSGINCGDASQKLSDLLACMKGKGITTTVSSVGDSQGFATCKAKTCACPPGKASCACSPCAHDQASCHYGGGASKTATECQQSHAADLSVRNSSGGVDVALANAIKSAASACGGRVNDETRGPQPHIHVSDQTSCCSL